MFFFDEAHLLFDDAPQALLEKIEQVVRLIRSKGVGVYFVTQNPLDIPDTVLGQLGNRVQHALRAFTPRDQKAVKSAATTLRANPKLDVEAAITELGVGEALVSLLDEKGRPSVVERAFVVPPGSRVGPVTAQERAAIMQVLGASPASTTRSRTANRPTRSCTQRRGRTGAGEGEPGAAGDSRGGLARGARREASSAARPARAAGGAKARSRRRRRARRARSRLPQRFGSVGNRIRRASYPASQFLRRTATRSAR